MTADEVVTRAPSARPRALIVVDVQGDFCEGGALAVPGGAQVARDLSAYLATARHYDLVVATRDAHIDPGSHFADQPDYVDTWPPHCVVGTAGQEFHPQLTWRDFDAVFDKGAFSAAYSGFEGADSHGRRLDDVLREHDVAMVDVCGIAQDYCVDATARDAAAAGFDTTVLTDLTVAVSPDLLATTLERWNRCGIRTRTSA